MYFLIYRTTNNINGKSYIGCYITADKNDGYLGSGVLLKKAIEKYGANNFTREILFEANTAQEMFEKEKELVILGKNSYNLKLGGKGGFAKGLKFLTTEQLSRIGKKSGNKTKRELSGLFDKKYDDVRSVWAGNAFRGKQHTDDAKRKISEANKNRIPWNKGKKIK